MALFVEQYGEWLIFEEITPSGKRLVSALKVQEAEEPGATQVYVEAKNREEVKRQIDLRETDRLLRARQQ